ncbi:MAG TPA: response regulator [Nitrospinota bacterium]|nr:response regulator [Nitrospinota bacterium]
MNMPNKNGFAKLLVVDDDDLVLQGFKSVLSGEGYEVDEVNSGRAALKLIRRDRFDLVLVDLMMEGIDGLGVLREVKKKSPDTVVVIVTGYESIESILEAMRWGAYDYLIKPCSEIDLKMTIRRGLEKQRIERKLVGAERLAAITKTALATNHKISSPLETIVLETELLLRKGDEFDEKGKERLEAILQEAFRIKDIMKKMSHITEPVISEYMDSVKMVDMGRSKTTFHSLKEGGKKK